MQRENANILSDLAPVMRETVQGRVHDRLRHLLMIGRFGPGQTLKIHDLSDAFGTSAQPVREAIRQLVAERALEALPNRSARVPVMDGSRLEDLRRVRLALEGLAAELAAERAGPAEIEALEGLLEEEARAEDEPHAETGMSRYLAFHGALYRISRSAALPPIIEGLWLQAGPHVRRARGALDAWAERHGATLAALRGRDGPAVRHAVEDGINRIFDRLAEARS